MTNHFLPPNSDRYDAAVEDAIATCNGDLRGALWALMLVNEQLESELVLLRHIFSTPICCSMGSAARASRQIADERVA